MYILDLAAKLDATAEYLCKATWGDVAYPPPFGRDAYPEVRPCIYGSCDVGHVVGSTVHNPHAFVSIL